MSQESTNRLYVVNDSSKSGETKPPTKEVRSAVKNTILSFDPSSEASIADFIVDEFAKTEKGGYVAEDDILPDTLTVSETSEGLFTLTMEIWGKDFECEASQHELERILVTKREDWMV